MSEGTTYTIDLPVSGTPGVNSAVDALRALQAQLEGQAAASLTAAEAVKAAESSYKTAEATADRMAKALERVTQRADEQRGKLKAAMDAGDGSGAERAAAKLRGLVAEQEKLEAKTKAATAALEKEAKALDGMKAADEGGGAGSGKVNEIAEGLGKLGGPLGKVGQKLFGTAEGFKKLGASLGSGGPYVAAAVAIVAIVAAVAAATAAFVAGVAAATQWAVTLADGARTSNLLAQGIAQSVEGGDMLQDHINSLSKEVPIAADELTKMAAGLAKTGLRGQELSTALEDAAVKAAEAKFGPAWEREMKSLNTQSRLLKGNITAIFSGLKIDRLLNALSKITDLFEENSASANAIKVVFESFFQPLVDGLEGLVPKIIAAFIQFEIWVLRALIFIKPFGSTLLTIGAAIAAVGVFIVAGLIAPFAAAAVAIAAVVAVAGLLVAGIAWLIVQFDQAVAAVGRFGASILTSIVEFFATVDLAQMGADLIAGLVRGITGAAGAVVGAVKGAVGGAIDGAKALLGIASPSKVFAEIGMNTSAGMVEGVEGGAAQVQGSLEAMVAPPAASDGAAPAPAAAPASGGTGDGGAASGSLAGATFNFYGVAGVEDAVERFIESVVAKMGGAVPA